MKKFVLYTLSIVFAVSFYSCSKEETQQPLSPDNGLASGPSITSVPATTGVYVLCEGFMGSNNSAISYYNVATGVVDKNYFKTKNGYDLGEAANDMKRYGNKIYVTITGIQGGYKSYVEVLNASTLVSLARIPFFAGTTAEYMPRNVAFSGSKAYVSCYDGYVRRIDTSTLTIEASVLAGGACEELTVSNGKLYVTNSDHPYHPYSTPTTVSVINIATFTKTAEITVGYNPARAVTANGGDVYVASWGSWANPSLTPQITRINTVTDAVATPVYSYDVQAMTVYGDNIYMVSTYSPWIKPFNTSTKVLGGNFITDGTTITTPYNITANQNGGDICIADVKGYTGDGEMFCFYNNGTLRFRFATGPMPQRAVFLY